MRKTTHTPITITIILATPRLAKRERPTKIPCVG